MTIRTVQKVIKIGTSLGVTIPAKELKRAGIKLGDEVEVTISKFDPTKDKEIKELMDHYEEFKKKYSQTLKNLSDK